MRATHTKLCPGSTGSGAAFVLLGAVCLAAFSPSVARADSEPSKEYKVKATFLFHFTQLVDWPDAAFPAADAPLCIGILGDDPFGGFIDQTVEGETVHRRKLVIQRSKQVGDLKGCQVLFISKSEAGHMDQILASLGDASILIVSEVEGFARHGGIVNFFLDGNKVRFEINPDVAKKHGLSISSQLLGLSRIIR